MGFTNYKDLFFLLIILSLYTLHVTLAIDTITSSTSIKDPETLSSKNGKFTLGFFNSPENSTNRYVGIWWQPQFTVIWVLNRNEPLKDSSGVVTISEDGNDIVVLNGQKEIIWTSTNVQNFATNSTAKLQDSGNLVLLEGITGRIIWESFQHPSNAMLPNMKLTSNKKTGEKVTLTSWKSPSDPSIGSFSSSVERLAIPELFIWNETHPYWRSGPWNGKIFTGQPYMKSYYLDGVRVGDDVEGNVFFFYTIVDKVDFIIVILNSQGNCEERSWDEKKKEWQITWNSHTTECDVYGVCGPFASCNSQSSPVCSCLKRFEPRNEEEWKRKNWTNGCVRRTPLQCDRASIQLQNTNTSVHNKQDGFVKLQKIKVPDFANGSSLTFSPDACKSQCLETCSCVAYSYDANIGCMSWSGNLIDIQQLSEAGLDLYIRVANTELDKERNMTIIITIATIAGAALILAGAYIMLRRNCIRHGNLSS